LNRRPSCARSRPRLPSRDSRVARGSATVPGATAAFRVFRVVRGLTLSQGLAYEPRNTRTTRRGRTPDEAWERTPPPKPVAIRSRDALRPHIAVRRSPCRGDPGLPVIEITVPPLTRRPDKVRGRRPDAVCPPSRQGSTAPPDASQNRARKEAADDRARRKHENYLRELPLTVSATRYAPHASANSPCRASQRPPNGTRRTSLSATAASGKLRAESPEHICLFSPREGRREPRARLREEPRSIPQYLFHEIVVHLPFGRVIIEH
jgi:hypothetical protein